MKVKSQQSEIQKLEDIYDLIWIDTEQAWNEAIAMMKRHQGEKLNYLSAKSQLIVLIIAQNIRSEIKNNIDTAALGEYFEANGHWEDASLLAQAVIRHIWGKGQHKEARELDAAYEKKYNGSVPLTHRINRMAWSASFYMRDYDKTGQLELMLKTEALLRTMTDHNAWYRATLATVLQYKAEALAHNNEIEKLNAAITESIVLIDTPGTSLQYIFTVYYFKANIDAIAHRVDDALECYLALEKRFEGKSFYDHLRIFVYLQIFKQLNIKFSDPNAGPAEKEELLFLQLKYFSLATSLPVTRNWPYILGYFYLSKGRLMRVTGDYTQAISNLGKALRIFSKNDDKLHIIDIYEEAHASYKLWAEKGSDPSLYRKAARAMENAYILTIRYNQTEGKEKMDALANKYELQQKELTEKLLRQKVDALNKEIQMAALNLHDKLIVLDELKEFIHSLHKKGQETNKLIHTIARKIDSVIITEQDKSTLQQKIDEGNAYFYQTLAEKYPALSTLEIHMCGLLKTGMTNKELSKLYGQSEKSYEQHRYRIKKKMGLTAEDKLVKILATIGMVNVSQ